MSDWLNRVRSFAVNSPFRRVLLSPPIRRAGSAVLSLRFIPSAWTLDRPIAFLTADARRAETSAYRLRNRNVTVVVRHESGALELVHEVFGARCYEPAAEDSAGFPADPTVLDLGANVGAFSAYVLSRWPDAHITCVEPDKDNLAALTRFQALHPWADIDVIPACATNMEGTVGFDSGQGEGSRVAEGGAPMRAIDALPLMAAAHFVKMDIEGSEWPVLRDPRLSALSNIVLVMEYHRRYPYDTGAEKEARVLLGEAGFTVGRTEPNYWGHGLMWATKG